MLTRPGAVGVKPAFGTGPSPPFSLSEIYGQAWDCFCTQNAFSPSSGLWTRRDYLENLSLHLPEIYEETIRTEENTRIFLSTRSRRALSDATVGMQHLAVHHISFAIQALQWMAEESSWLDPEVARERQEVTGLLRKIGVKDPEGRLARRLALKRRAVPAGGRKS